MRIRLAKNSFSSTLVAALLVFPMSGRTQSGLIPEDDASFEKFKSKIRETGKSNPTETQAIIERLDSDRRKLKNYRAQPEQIGKDLEPMIQTLRINNSSSTVMEFAKAQSALEKQLSWLSQNGIEPSNDTGNKISEEIIDIYAEHAKFWKIPTHFPMMVAARFGNSPKVKNYVFGILNGPSKDDRHALLSELAWSRSFVDDQQLYNTLMDIYKTEGTDTALPLAVMSRLNRKKTLPIVLQEIDTTTKIKTFTQDEDILSEYHDPNLLDHPLRRIKDFPRTSWGDIKNPTLGIHPDLLLKYIQGADGERLELGLAALEQSVRALSKSYPIVREKLKSSNAANRRAAARFLQRSVDIPTFNHPEIVEELDAMSHSETDPESQKAIRTAVQQMRAKSTKPRP